MVQQIHLNNSINLTPITPVDRQFHLLVQQLTLGLNIDSLIAEQPFYQANLNDLKLELPGLEKTKNSQKTFDYCINYPCKKGVLRTKYDLVKADKNKAHIHHWRHLQPIDENTLVSNWQTRLDLWLITRQLKYDPNQVQITYWFLTPFKLVQSTIIYNPELHDEFTEIIENSTSEPQTIKVEKSLTTLFLEGQITSEEYIDLIPEYPL